MNDNPYQASATRNDEPKLTVNNSSRTLWAVFVGLAAYLFLTGSYSLMALLYGVMGQGWAGAFETKVRIWLLILGAHLPLTVAALVVLGVGMRLPPVRWCIILVLLGLGFACLVSSVVADVAFGVDLY